MGAEPSPAVVKKAGAYLATGAVTVESQDDRTAVVLVKGSASEPYRVTFAGTWSCDCPARRTCAHVLAALYKTKLTETASPEMTADSEVSDLLGTNDPPDREEPEEPEMLTPAEPTSWLDDPRYSWWKG